MFPGFGDPIISIDSTKDGKYLLATCSKYLILLPTFSNGVNGFNNTILNVDKKIPIKLTLTPTDIYRYKIKNLDFKPAKFDENLVKKENFIITCTGKYTIVWSMSEITSGNVNKYEVKGLNDDVLKVEFKFNNQNNIYAAFKDGICLQQTKDTKKERIKTKK